MHELTFDLKLSSNQYRRYYSGLASVVIVRCHDGRKVQFPANILRCFVQHDGIHGRFALSFDDAGHYHSLKQIN